MKKVLLLSLALLSSMGLCSAKTNTVSVEQTYSNAEFIQQAHDALDVFYNHAQEQFSVIVDFDDIDKKRSSDKELLRIAINHMAHPTAKRYVEKFVKKVQEFSAKQFELENKQSLKDALIELKKGLNLAMKSFVDKNKQCQYKKDALQKEALEKRVRHLAKQQEKRKKKKEYKNLLQLFPIFAGNWSNGPEFSNNIDPEIDEDTLRYLYILTEFDDALDKSLDYLSGTEFDDALDKSLDHLSGLKSSSSFSSCCKWIARFGVAAIVVVPVAHRICRCLLSGASTFLEILIVLLIDV